MYTENSTIGLLLSNPLGDDIVTTISEQAGIHRNLIYNPIVKAITLKQLKWLSRGVIDDTFVEMLCRKLNEYQGVWAPVSDRPVKKTWWKEAVAYQIYPRSFKDSNGDGIGDIQGIISKLDYLQALGINLIWLSPIYDSPNDDNGYDIRDYYKIMEEFGTIDDFQRLLDEAHSRSIRLIMDLVVNHTSDEHPWFQEAKTSKDNPYRDYYLWKEGKEGELPNNWTSFFSGDTWNWYEETQSYGLHLFSKKQMDLNWDHEPMRQSIYEMIRYWLDMGIDGFRLDVINYISKDAALPRGSELVGQIMGYFGAEHYFFGPHLHEYLREMRRETFDKYDVVTIGETPGIGLNLSELLTHEDRGELDMVFNFEHLDQIGKSRQDDYVFDLNHLKQVFIKWQTKYNHRCWNSLYYDNHDNPRMLSKVDQTGKYRKPLGKLLAMLQLTLKGTPFIYQGQELGLTNGLFHSIRDFHDVESLNLYEELKAKGQDEATIMTTLMASTRDHARLVIPWNDGPGKGFTLGEPWISADYMDPSVTCASELADEDSIFHFYRKLIAMRHSNRDLVYGSFEVVHRHRRDYFGYYRHGEERTFFIHMNLSNQAIPAYEKTWQYKLLLGNYPNESNILRPYECRLYVIGE